MRKQVIRDHDYTKDEVNVFFEGAIVGAAFVGITYRLEDAEKVVNIGVDSARAFMKRMPHEHFLALDSDTCFACGIPLTAGNPD